MASYDLNEVLKKREQEKAKSASSGPGSSSKNQEVDLGDVSRVKVLSPGRQVFKRFIRNRLAVFGSVVLIILFIFSFFGPLLYPYGQKQIFYKYDYQNVNYALAKENTGYNGYDVDSSVPVERSIVNAMNSNIKKMIASGTEEMSVIGTDGNYVIRRELPNIYTLSSQDLTMVCGLGDSNVKIGTWSMIGKTFTFEEEEIPGVAQAAASIKGASGSFEVDGVEYTFTKGEKPKTFDVFTVKSGLFYTGNEPGGDFEKDLKKAIDSNSTAFTSGDESYSIVSHGSRQDVYKAGESRIARVYTTYTLDTF